MCCAIRNDNADPGLGQVEPLLVVTKIMDIHFTEIDWDSNKTMEQIRDCVHHLLKRCMWLYRKLQ